ncbi:MAG: 6-phosphofructokinase [Bdellovibrionales bacterium]|nr:6-phosphofructokinase [Bdellovibrionales bacterium]
MAQFNPQNLRNICVLTSGGDAPGMNAAIRAVVRAGISNDLGVVGSHQGYFGLMNSDFVSLSLRSVANIIQRGGTFLKTGRCPEFHNKEIRQRAVENLKRNSIDALVVIGGDGSLTAAHLLWEEFQFPVVGIPGTIDNDMSGCDATIGFDTAVNTALEAIDRIRDTATSHDRLFIVEVMGRNSGFIAIDVGVAGGAEGIFIPEIPFQVDSIIKKIQLGIKRKKSSSILIAAEGQKPGRAYDLAEAIRKNSGMEAKVCILGHIQRGGSPSAKDRILGTRLGAAAVNTLLHGISDVMVGTRGEEVQYQDILTCINTKRQMSRELIELCEFLAK